MTERVVIVGGGVSGLVANWVFRQHNVQPVVLEPGPLGGDFLKGGLKYIHKTQPMCDMFDVLDLPWSDYTVQGGILLRGKVLSYPKCLDAMPEAEANRIQADHYYKTRQAEAGRFGERAMNDPAANKTSRRAIRCDFHELIKELGKRANVLKAPLAAIDGKGSRIQLADGSWHPYTKLVLTIPLWVIRKMADFYVPHGMAMSLNLVQVSPRKDPYARWDYVYTPYTPGDAVHRFSPREAGYSVEVNGDWDQKAAQAMDDLAFLFPDGYVVEDIVKGVKGHLLKLAEKADWPENVAPLGRFAQWNPRATTDVTLDSAFQLAKEWGWKRNRAI